MTGLSRTNPHPFKHAYTDEPALQRNLILGSLHLVFWLYFHPSAWRHYVNRLDPTLSETFALTQLNRSHWRNPRLLRLLAQGYGVWPVLAGLSVGLTLWLRGAPFESIIVPVLYVAGINLTLGLMIGAVISVATGIASGLLVSLAAGIVASVTSGVAEGIVTATAVGFAIGAGLSMAASMAGQKRAHSLFRPLPSFSIQIGSIVIGVLVGVVAAAIIRVGLTTLTILMVGLPEPVSYNLSRGVVVGTSLGIALGWRRGVRAGVAGGVICGLAYLLAVTGGNSNLNSVVIGLSAGSLFGLSFGVTVVLPYVLSEQIAGAWAGAWAGALGSWGRHVVRNEILLWPALPLGLLGISAGLTMAWWRPLVVYPVEAAWNLVLYRLDERRSRQPSGLLRRHAAFWDELQRLPLAGLDSHLLMIMDRNPAEGQLALEYLSTGHQRWAVQAVQIELEARRLERCDDITAISQVHRDLSTRELAGPASTILRSFERLSQDVEVALVQTTAYHQRLALNSTGERLNGLARELMVSSDPYAARFYPIATHWDHLVTNRLRELSQTVEQSQEIDNPYIVGVPLTRQQEIFVGRTDIVARIEQLVLDRRRPPLLLYGQRRMGKTSLLRNLGQLMPQRIIPLFIDGQRTALASDYADLLYNLAREMERAAKQQRQLMLPSLNPEAVAGSPFTGFNEWLDDVEQRFAQTDHIALLALDEFEMLGKAQDKGRFDETDILSMLRHIIQHRTRFKIMLAGSHTLEELQQWASYLINVQVIKIGYLYEDEARQLIEHPVKNFALHYEPAASRRILDLTRGHPALVQLLCYEIVTLKNEQPPAERRLVRPADVDAAIPRALTGGSFFFGDIVQNQVSPTGVELLRFIAAHGEGATVSEAVLAAQVEDPAQLRPTLDLLLQRELIEATAQGYRFQVELIRRWFERLTL
jgi:hypothetical protein